MSSAEWQEVGESVRVCWWSARGGCIEIEVEVAMRESLQERRPPPQLYHRSNAASSLPTTSRSTYLYPPANLPLSAAVAIDFPRPTQSRPTPASCSPRTARGFLRRGEQCFKMPVGMLIPSAVLRKVGRLLHQLRRVRSGASKWSCAGTPVHRRVQRTRTTYREVRGHR